ncbi:MAG: abortive infection family protein [Bacteroidetes bacterium]|nr:abortive infection family protein [Bacteroidota bacterium]
MILDERNVTYDEKADLPALYKAVAKELNLSPDQHTEQIFKQILGGCQTVVEGLGALRNAYGDAHGKRLIRKKPNKRHSDLAINLAGTMAMFLLETFENVKSIVEPTPE